MVNDVRTNSVNLALVNTDVLSITIFLGSQCGVYTIVVGDIPVTRLYRGKMNSNSQTRYLNGNRVIVCMCKSVSSRV